MVTYLRGQGTRVTPQSQPILGSTQVANDAGGYAWPVDDWTRLDRFLVLGSEGGTYYVGEQKLTRENAEAVARCIKADGLRSVQRIVEISETGRAAKNDPALFALAMASGLGDEPTRRAAFDALPKVARIGTHLFHFAQYREQFGGWGRLCRRAFDRWYQQRDAKSLAYQMVKYQGRDGWTHRDLLRLTKPVPVDEQHSALYHWATKGWESVGDEPHPDEALRLVWAFERAKRAQSVGEVAGLIREHGLPREAIPTQWLNEQGVWSVLLKGMPLTAMIRNLATMTRVGLLQPMMSGAVQYVGERLLSDPDGLRKARIHPISILAALTTYAQGHGERGHNTWTPVPQIVDALDRAFYLSFGNVQPTNKRILVGVDVSGSMANTVVNGVPGLDARKAAAAMALVTLATEPNTLALAFDTKLYAPPVSARQRLDDVVRTFASVGGGGTDCALPIVYAFHKNLPVDAFVILTDSETWQGDMHPSQAIQAYRKKTGIQAKLIVVAMCANKVTLADPNDAGMLNVVGFDTATPELIRDFIAS